MIQPGDFDVHLTLLVVLTMALPAPHSAVTHSSSSQKPPRSGGLTGYGRWICLIRSRVSFLSTGIPTRSPPDRFDESPLPLYPGRKSGGFNQMYHCSVFQRRWRCTLGHFTNERHDPAQADRLQMWLVLLLCGQSQQNPVCFVFFYFWVQIPLCSNTPNLLN